MARYRAGETIREAVGIFFDSTRLGETIDDLRASGFEADTVGVLAGARAVEEKLGAGYRQAEPAEAPSSVSAAGSGGKSGGKGPNMAFVADQSQGDTVHALLGDLYFVGSTAASGAIVASAALFGGALLAAAGGVAALAGVGTVLAGIIHQSDAEHLEEQVDEGHLLLFVKTASEDQEARAIEILTRHSAFEPRVYSAPAGARPAAAGSA